MLTLIKNARIYAPRDLGNCDLLICNNKIARIDSHLMDGSIFKRDDPLQRSDVQTHISPLNGLALETIDAAGMIVTPGFVDTLVHITGGGGEGGYLTRTPELNVEEAINSGVTTVIGALGTDANTRSLRELFGKTKSLNAQGISCFMYTGSYEVPIRTLTTSIKDDIIFVDPIIGVGEVAIADHRGSQPTAPELARIAAEARVAGMISGKRGVVLIHVGEGKECLSLLHSVIDTTEVSAQHFYATHINRSEALIKAGVRFAKLGGGIDFTASTTDTLVKLGEIRASKALAMALRLGAPSDRLTMSSDAQGSLPHFDSNGKLDGLEVGRIDSLAYELKLAIQHEGLDIPVALAAVTRNPADITGLYHKGRISVGADADINLLNAETLAVVSVMAKGKWLKRDNVIHTSSLFCRAAP